MFAVKATLRGQSFIVSSWEYRDDAKDACVEGADAIPLGFKALGGRVSIATLRPDTPLCDTRTFTAAVQAAQHTVFMNSRPSIGFRD